MKRIFFVLSMLTIIIGGCGTEQEPLGATGQKTEATLDFLDSSEIMTIDPFGEVTLHYSAVFENTNETPLEIADMELNIFGQNGKVIGNAQEVFVNPRVVRPGEKVYLTESVPLPLANSQEDYEETVPHYVTQLPTVTQDKLETFHIKENKADGYSITGQVRNTTEETMNLVQLTAGLFNENDHLIAVMSGSVNSELPPGEQIEFHISHPSLDSNMINQIEEIEVVAAPAWQP